MWKIIYMDSYVCFFTPTCSDTQNNPLCSFFSQQTHKTISAVMWQQEESWWAVTEKKWTEPSDEIIQNTWSMSWTNWTNCFKLFLHQYVGSITWTSILNPSTSAPFIDLQVSVCFNYCIFYRFFSILKVGSIYLQHYRDITTAKTVNESRLLTLLPCKNHVHIIIYNQILVKTNISSVPNLHSTIK